MIVVYDHTKCFENLRPPAIFQQVSYYGPSDKTTVQVEVGMDNWGNGYKFLLAYYAACN